VTSTSPPSSRANTGDGAPWVVKLGGSLTTSSELPAWLRMLADDGAGRVIVVAGGGAFADVARQMQSRWRIDDVAAHNMAVLGMVQSAHLLRSIEPRLVPASGDGALLEVLRQGRVALWMPYEAMREQRDELTSWDVTSDSLALRLAGRLHAQRLVVVKSCKVAPALDLQAFSATGVLDRRFGTWAAEATFPIDVVESAAVAAVRAQLHEGPPAALSSCCPRTELPES
jgi:5-(aminomethyl)-3-furanmethanol phosphate kinase